MTWESHKRGNTQMTSEVVKSRQSHDLNTIYRLDIKWRPDVVSHVQ